MEPRTVAAYEQAARATLPEAVWEFFRGGADEERTLRWNREALERVVIWPRVLVDVAKRSRATRILGEEIALPVLVAPVACQRLAHPGGEREAARGANAAGTIYIAPTVATTPLEDVSAASPGTKWFQLYPHRDRGFTAELVARARAAGYRALVVTVDTPQIGRKLGGGVLLARLPDGVELAHLYDGLGGDHQARVDRLAGRHDPSFGWSDLDRLAATCGMPLVAKGILRGDDAARAVESGARALIVSNHGGRQLDGAPASIDALPRIADRVGGGAEVLMDGGIGSGLDVLRAIASGARAVLIGRAAMWGLAVAGAAGVERVLGLLGEELDAAMALSGCTTVAAIDRGLLAPG